MGATELLVVRHGESVGNTAARAAHELRAEVVDVPARDPDVGLSATGVDQARALGAWLGELPPDRAPQSVWSSPYVRSADTARLALEVSGLHLPITIDERLRDRELGVLDRLTGAGAVQVDDVRPLGAGGGEAAKGFGGVGGVDRCLVEAALAKAHDLAAHQVHGGEQNHESSQALRKAAPAWPERSG